MNSIMTKKLLFLLLIAIYALQIANANKVVNLTPENFDAEVFQSSRPAFVEFFAPWCGHCKRLAPIFEAVADHFIRYRDEAHPVLIAKVDADRHSDLRRRFNIQGYPTIYYFSGIQNDPPKEYSGRRTAYDIIAHLHNTVPGLSPINDAEIDAVELPTHFFEEDNTIDLPKLLQEGKLISRMQHLKILKSQKLRVPPHVSVMGGFVAFFALILFVYCEVVWLVRIPGFCDRSYMSFSNRVFYAQIAALPHLCIVLANYSNSLFSSYKALYVVYIIVCGIVQCFYWWWPFILETDTSNDKWGMEYRRHYSRNIKLLDDSTSTAVAEKMSTVDYSNVIIPDLDHSLYSCMLVFQTVVVAFSFIV